MFEEARIKLTLWYLAIIMAITLVFTFAIYFRINTELSRFENLQVRFQEDLREGRVRELPGPRPHPERLSPQEVREARIRLIISLLGIDLGILVLSGLAGYFLAGKTLKPISEMVEDQNRFISDSSHELRTPLTSLRSEIEVALRSKNLTSGQAKKIMESNLEDVISLQILSDKLLELSQSGILATDLLEKVNLKQVISSAVKKTENMAKAKKIQVEGNIPNLKVMGINDRLSELFVILLDNAIKYSPQKSLVRITGDSNDGKVKISIADKGLGISEEDQPHIFDRFYRGDTSRTKTQIEGYGLGLSIAKKIVEQHGGEITVESKKGKGSTFSVILKRA